MLVLSFRERDIAGGIAGPTLYEVDPADPALGHRPVSAHDWAARRRGRHVLFAVHGFNVAGRQGVRSLAGFSAGLGLGAADLYIAVIWPGDWWLPAVNYPFAGDTAGRCGQRLAKWCAAELRDAASLSFVSHSLGARLVLEAVQRLNRRVRLLCLMAGAVNCDCLGTQFAGARALADTIEVLASRADLVLALAFPAGDALADALEPDHVPLTAALGRSGPARIYPGQLQRPWQIVDPGDFGHGSYLPDDLQPAAADAHWLKAARFVGRAWRGERQDWPA